MRRSSMRKAWNMCGLDLPQRRWTYFARRMTSRARSRELRPAFEVQDRLSHD